MNSKQKKTLVSLIIVILTSLGLFDYFSDGEIREIISFFPDQEVQSEKVEKSILIKKKIPSKRTLVFEKSKKTPVVEGKSKKFYNIFFSQVYQQNPKLAERNLNSIDRHLARVIKSAKKYIYISTKTLKSNIITDALLQAHRKRVVVKVVTDDKYNQERSIIRLKKAGISVIDDSSVKGSGLMHNKFLVIDGKSVWTGSFNTTYNGSYKNNNNAILIHSRKIAENYLDEFNEMFNHKSFGRSSPKTIKHKIVKLNDGTVIRTLFAPENQVGNAIVQQINKAKRSIHFLAFSFTHDKIGDAMMKKYREGVLVKGVFEKTQNSKYSEYHRMKQLGIQTVKIDGSKYKMHHKVIIIDGRVTVVGSFNFSKNADTNNDENVLIIESSDIAKVYLDEFQKLYEIATQ